MLRNKGIKFFLICMLVVFCVGVVVGSVYAVGISGDAEKDIQNYLNNFFLGERRVGKDIFISSLLNNLKIFSVIFIAGFFKLGIPFTLGIGCVQGFTSGFTASALIKIMGWKGLFVNLSSLFSVLIFVLDLMFFGAFSMNYATFELKNDIDLKKKYIFSSLFFLTIFCVASFFDGYITTIFMNWIVTKM